VRGPSLPVHPHYRTLDCDRHRALILMRLQLVAQ
jgi:hypothetical protein